MLTWNSCFHFVYYFNDLQCMYNIFYTAGRQGKNPNGNWVTKGKGYLNNKKTRNNRARFKPFWSAFKYIQEFNCLVMLIRFGPWVSCVTFSRVSPYLFIYFTLPCRRKHSTIMGKTVARLDYIGEVKRCTSKCSSEYGLAKFSWYKSIRIEST